MLTGDEGRVRQFIVFKSMELCQEFCPHIYSRCRIMGLSEIGFSRGRDDRVQRERPRCVFKYRWYRRDGIRFIINPQRTGILVASRKHNRCQEHRSSKSTFHRYSFLYTIKISVAPFHEYYLPLSFLFHIVSTPDGIKIIHDLSSCIG